jgi:hypothetical protein
MNIPMLHLAQWFLRGMQLLGMLPSLKTTKPK